jgi:hypothetical protein
MRIVAAAINNIGGGSVGSNVSIGCGGGGGSGAAAAAAVVVIVVVVDDLVINIFREEIECIYTWGIRILVLARSITALYTVQLRSLPD